MAKNNVKEAVELTERTAIETMIDQVVNDLKEVRESKDITTAKLAELTGIAQPNITRLETGGAKPNLKTVATIAHALGVKLVIVNE